MLHTTISRVSLLQREGSIQIELYYDPMPYDKQVKTHDCQLCTSLGEGRVPVPTLNAQVGKGLKVHRAEDGARDSGNSKWGKWRKQLDTRGETKKR